MLPSVSGSSMNLIIPMECMSFKCSVNSSFFLLFYTSNESSMYHFQVAMKTSTTILCVKGLSEVLICVFCCHGVATSMKPHQTLKRMLVHPKDKHEMRDMTGVVYQIPSKDCLKIYMGETERRFGTREKEHRWDMNLLEAVKFTRCRKKDSLTEVHLSELTTHVAQTNHTINWDSVKLPMKEDTWIT